MSSSEYLVHIDEDKRMPGLVVARNKLIQAASRGRIRRTGRLIDNYARLAAQPPRDYFQNDSPYEALGKSISRFHHERDRRAAGYIIQITGVEHPNIPHSLSDSVFAKLGEARGIGVEGKEDQAKQLFMIDELPEITPSIVEGIVEKAFSYEVEHEVDAIRSRFIGKMSLL